MENRVSRIRRFGTQPETSTPHENGNTPTLLEHYSIEIFNTPETKAQLEHISPLISTLDTLSQELDTKKAVLSYLIWTVKDDTAASISDLGITVEEYKKHLDSLLDQKDKNQVHKEDLFNKFENLGEDAKKDLAKQLISVGWSTNHVNQLLDLNMKFLSMLRSNWLRKIKSETTSTHS